MYNGYLISTNGWDAILYENDSDEWQLMDLTAETLMGWLNSDGYFGDWNGNEYFEGNLKEHDENDEILACYNDGKLVVYQPDEYLKLLESYFDDTELEQVIACFSYIWDDGVVYIDYSENDFGVESFEKLNETGVKNFVDFLIFYFGWKKIPAIEVDRVYNVTTMENNINKDLLYNLKQLNRDEFDFLVDNKIIDVEYQVSSGTIINEKTNSKYEAKIETRPGDYNQGMILISVDTKSFLGNNCVFLETYNLPLNADRIINEMCEQLLEEIAEEMENEIDEIVEKINNQ